MNYYISDLHLFHANVTAEGSNFDGRPFKTLEEMHEVIKTNWNNTVTNADHVYILGDLAWKENEDVIALVSKLKGNKHLILGNHDRVKDQRYKQLFVEVCNHKEVKDTINGKEYHVVLSHYPLAFWNHQHHYRRDGEKHKVWSIQLYGHVHNSNEEVIFQNYIKQLNDAHNIKCIAKNVGCMMEYMNYIPRTLSELITCDVKEKI
nr:metallophosphoesterase family protein [uncultured Lachnoclostridium sp.]